MCATPSMSPPVTSPAADTVATDALSLDHVMGTPATNVPALSRGTARNCT